MAAFSGLPGCTNNYRQSAQGITGLAWDLVFNVPQLESHATFSLTDGNLIVNLQLNRTCPR